MDIIESIVLGLIQGLTEFLPVSSSGHLELAKTILGDTSVPQESLTFTIVLHFATALSTLVIYRKEVAEILNNYYMESVENLEVERYLPNNNLAIDEDLDKIDKIVKQFQNHPSILKINENVKFHALNL